MATTSTFKHVNEAIGFFGFSPEVSYNKPTLRFKASGGTTTTFVPYL